MKRTFIYFLLAASLLPTACSKDDGIMEDEPQPSGNGLVLRIAAGSYLEEVTTRASDEGVVTHFENGDKVGVLILEDGQPIDANNLPFVSDGQGNWTFDESTALKEGTGKVLYMSTGTQEIEITVYYPYTANANAAKNIADLKALLPPLDDQSGEDSYRLSDLMFWTDIRSAADLTVDATLAHAYASVSLTTGFDFKLVTDDRITIAPSDVNFTVGEKVNITPYRAEDGSYRLILPADFTAGEVRWFYTFGNARYSGSRNLPSVAANTCYSKTEMNDIEYGFEYARIGDLYCTKDNGATGYLIPKEADASVVQKANVVGIVFQTDPARIGEAEKAALKAKGINEPHGLVMSVRNAGTSLQWCPNGTYEGLTKCYTKADNYNDISGYGNCEHIRSNRGNFDNYPAFKAADDYNTNCKVPETTTGWYLPSSGQWWDILQNLGGCPDLADKGQQTSSDQDDPFCWSDQGDVPAALNAWMGKIATDSKDDFIGGNWFWSSSECSGYSARGWLVYEIGPVTCYWYLKIYTPTCLRPVLAF